MKPAKASSGEGQASAAAEAVRHEDDATVRGATSGGGGVLWLVAAGLAGVALVCAVTPRVEWWYGVLLDLSATAVLPALLLGVLALGLAPRGPGLAVLLAALVLGGVTTFATPRLDPAASVGLAHAHDGRSVRTMTYNIWLGSPHLDDSLELIAESDPDILALQEVGTSSARRLAALDDYPNIVLTPRDALGNGDGLLSRFPIRSFEGHDLGADGGRISAYVVDVEGIALLVLNVHLSRPPFSPLDAEGWKSNLAERLGQVDFIDELARSHGGPVVVLGDMNSPAGGRVHERMVVDLDFQDVLSRSTGWGGDTFPYRLFPGAVPVWSIDYVFTRGGVEVERSWVPRGGGSDHLPVVADLRLPMVRPHGHGESTAGTTGAPDAAKVSRKH